MTKQIKWRITAVYLALIVVSMVALAAVVSYSVEREFVLEVRTALHAHAQLSKSTIEDHITSDPKPQSLNSLCRMLSARVHYRVLVRRPDGVILGSSDTSQAKPGNAQMPQSMKMLRARFGCVLCHGEIRRNDAEVASVPLYRNHVRIGSVTLSTSLYNARQAAGKTRRIALAALVLATTIAALVSHRLAAGIADPISRMNSMAQRIAAGDLDQRVDVAGRPDEIGQLGASLNRMTDNIRREVEIRREFLANASHELRTPVASLRAMVGALQSGGVDDPEAARRFLDTMDSEAGRLSQLLNDLLSISALDSGKIRPNRCTTELQDLALQATEILSERAEARKITLSVDIPDNLTVCADRGQILQVLLNLVDNAINYSPEGASVDITAEAAESQVSIRVRDTGMGIPEQEQQRVFERFYRVDKTRSRQLGGTGLGLAIVRDIVAAHGGEVSVSSTPGGGSTFTVVLCRAPRTSVAGDSVQSQTEVSAPS